MSENKHVFNWTYGLFGQNYGDAALATLYLTVSGIIIHFELLNKNAKIVMFKMDTLPFWYCDYRVASLFTRYLTAKGIIPERNNR